jgi:hypothetical protein
VKKWFLLLCLFAISSVAAFSQTAVLPIYACIQAGVQAKTSGLPSSNYLQGIIPYCTVEVFLTGTTTVATTSPQSPFKANSDGSIPPIFAAVNQGYDVVLSGGIAPNIYLTPVTLTGLYPGFEFTGGGGSGNLSGTLTAPAVPYASDAHTLSDSAFQYYATGADPSSLCISGQPCWQAVHSGEGTVSISADRISIVNALDDAQQTVINDGEISILRYPQGSIVPTYLNQGSLNLGGSTSGSAQIGVAADAGTSNPILLPTSTGSPGYVLSTDGGSPQQTSWAPSSSVTSINTSTQAVTTPGVDAIGSITPYVDIRAYGALMDGATPINTALTAAQAYCAYGFSPVSCDILIPGYGSGALLGPTSTPLTPSSPAASTVRIQGTLQLSSTLVLNGNTIEGECGAENEPFINTGCTGGITGPNAYGTLGTDVTTPNTLVTLTPTFTAGSMTNLIAGSAITISDQVSVTASVTLSSSDLNYYTATLDTETKIPVASVITVTGCSDAGFDSPSNGVSVYTVDWPNKTMSWYGPTGTAGTATGCTITGLNYATYESVDITASDGTTISFTPSYNHSASAQWGEVAIKNPPGNFYHAELKNLRITAAPNAAVYWGEDSTGTTLDGVSLIPSGEGIAAELTGESFQGSSIKNSSLPAITQVPGNGNGHCGVSNQCVPVSFPAGLLCDGSPSNGPEHGSGGGCPSVIENTVIRGGIYIRSNPYSTPDSNVNFPNMTNVTLQSINGCGITYDPSVGWNIYTPVVITTLDFSDPVGGGVDGSGNFAYLCATEPYSRGTSVVRIVSPSSPYVIAAVNNYWSNQYTLDGVTGSILTYGRGLPAQPPAPLGPTEDGLAKIGELRGVGSGLGPQVIPSTTLPTLALSDLSCGSYCTSHSALAPDGTTNATEFDSITSSGGYLTVGSSNLQTYAGDWIIFGSWMRPAGANRSITCTSTLQVGSYGTDTLVGSNAVGGSDYDMGLTNDYWHPLVNLASVTVGDSTTHSVQFRIFAGCPTGTGLQYYDPFWIDIPGPNNPAYTGVTEDEVERWRMDLMHATVPQNYTGGTGHVVTTQPIDAPGYNILNPATGAVTPLSYSVGAAPPLTCTTVSSLAPTDGGCYQLSTSSSVAMPAASAFSIFSVTTESGATATFTGVTLSSDVGCSGYISSTTLALTGDHSISVKSDGANIWASCL